MRARLCLTTLPPVSWAWQRVDAHYVFAGWVTEGWEGTKGRGQIQTVDGDCSELGCVVINREEVTHLAGLEEKPRSGMDSRRDWWLSPSEPSLPAMDQACFKNPFIEIKAPI